MLKRLIAFTIAAILLLSLCGCSGDQETVKTLLEQNQALTEELASLKAGMPSDHIYCVNSSINGQTCISALKDVTYTATAIIPEGMTVNYWTLNGITQGCSDDTFTFTASGGAVVEAVLRPEKTIETINAQMYFLDANKQPAGDSFKKFVFEDSYTNPISGKTEAEGVISVYIEAEIPQGHMVDYWLINGVVYDAEYSISGFWVEYQTESAVYEPVFAKIPETPQTPEPTQPVVQYYVSCLWCSFNGITEGYVPEGTTIYVVGNSHITGNFFVNGSKYNTEWVTAISVTIYENTYIEFYSVVN